MSETDAIVLPLARRAGGDSHHPEPSRRGDITFDRRELTQILNVYGRKVASGEWRDYAIDIAAREGGVLGVPPRVAKRRSTASRRRRSWRAGRAPIA